MCVCVCVCVFCVCACGCVCVQTSQQNLGVIERSGQFDPVAAPIRGAFFDNEACFQLSFIL